MPGRRKAACRCSESGVVPGTLDEQSLHKQAAPPSVRVLEWYDGVTRQRVNIPAGPEALEGRAVI